MTDGAIRRTLREGAQFSGLTIAGDRIAWLEQPSTADSPAALYAADWRTGRSRNSRGTSRLELYDLAEHRLTVVAQGTGQILGRHGFLWWSTGSEPALAWHVLNLHSLGR